jgi:DNA-binding Lrp family transcriptional regulator
MKLLVDEKDRRILFELDKNSRAPISKVAKACHLPKHVVRYRIAELERKGIILQYYAVADLTCLGYLNFREAWKFADAPPSVLKEISSYLSKSPKLWWAARVSPFYDIVCAGWARDVNDAYDFLKGFHARFGIRIKQESTAFYTYFKHFPKRYLYPGQHAWGKVPTIGGKTVMKYDEKDILILSTLSQDARASIQAIARVSGLSETAARQRIKRLEKEGAIIAYRLLLDYEKLGLLYFWAHCRFRNFASMDRVEAAICENPAVVYTDRAVGEMGLGIDFVYSSQRELEAYLSSLQSMFPSDIREIEYVTVLENLKVLYTPSELGKRNG